MVKALSTYYGCVLLLAVISFTCIYRNMHRTTQVSSKHKGWSVSIRPTSKKETRVQLHEEAGAQTTHLEDVQGDKGIQKVKKSIRLTSPTDAEDVTEMLTTQACPWDRESPLLDDKTKKKYEIYDLLQMKKPHFLPHYKNPCWREDDSTKLVCLPYFFLVGFPKCGSSFTFSSICGHPEMARPTKKEPDWLSRTRFDGRPELKWYLDVFSQASSVIDGTVLTDSHTGERYHPVITGDGSTTAVWHNPHWRYLPGNYNCSEPRVLNQHYIYHMNPAVKVIVVIRNPTDRLISAHNYFGREQATSESFHQQVVNNLRQNKDCRSKFSMRTCAYGRTTGLVMGMYHIFIKDWMKMIPRDQMYIARLEDMYEDPVLFLTEIFDFLGLSPVSRSQLDGIIKYSRRNKSEKYFQVKNETRRLLQDFYRPHNIELAELFHHKFAVYI